MPYVIEVDQSIKIEQSGATVLAYAGVSNPVSHAIIIPASVKIEAMRMLFRRRKSPQTAHLLLFAACLCLLLKERVQEFARIEIDTEYEGKEREIRGVLGQYLRRTIPTFDPSTITFRRVGKGLPSDRKARAVRLGQEEGERMSLEDLVKVLKV